MQIPRIDANNALGLLDKVVGLGKEIAGNVIGRERLIKAGQTQQDKGTERLKAVQSELRARQHQAKAAAAQRSQRTAQKAKEAVNG
jgi:uncharacterized protein YjbJ (UPF0337 family)